MAGFLRDWWHLRGIREFESPGYLTAGIDHLPIPAPPAPECPRPGVLCWPNGASRWATFHALVTGEQLAGIGTSAMNAGGLLVLDDGTDAVSTAMFLLPPRVVCRHEDADYFLLTLVDDRYFWWQRVASVAAGGTWADLIGGLLTAAGVSSPSTATVPSAYGSPDPTRWNVGYKPLPLLIDAACLTVGLRLARGLDGSVVCAAAAAAAIQEDDQWADLEPECMAGGRVAAAWVAGSVPEKVTVVFPGTSPATADKTLASLSIVDFGAATGVAVAAGFIVADMPATASGSDRTSYANQAAIDYYLWAMGRVGATFRGFVAWGPTGNEDRVEWDHADKPLTRVYRSAQADRNIYGGLPALTTPAPLPGSAAAASCDAWTGLSTTLSCPTWETEGTPSGLCSTVPQQSGSFTYSSADSGSVPTWTSRTKELDDVDYAPSFVTTLTADTGDDPATRTTVGDLFLTVRGGRAMEYRYWTAAEYAARSPGDPYAHTYPLTYDGCRDGQLSFTGGSSELCEGSGTTCGNDTFVVGVKCDACATIDCAGCTLPKRFCLYFHDMDLDVIGWNVPIQYDQAYSGAGSDRVLSGRVVVRYEETGVKDGFPAVKYFASFRPYPGADVETTTLWVLCTPDGPRFEYGASLGAGSFFPPSFQQHPGTIEAGDPQSCGGIPWDLPLYNTTSVTDPRPLVGYVTISDADAEDGCGSSGGDGTTCAKAAALTCGSSATVHVPSGATRWLKVATADALTLTMSGGTGSLTAYAGTCDSLGMALGSTDGSAPLVLTGLTPGTILIELHNTGSGADFTVSTDCPVGGGATCAEAVEIYCGVGQTLTFAAAGEKWFKITLAAATVFRVFRVGEHPDPGAVISVYSDCSGTLVPVDPPSANPGPDILWEGPAGLAAGTYYVKVAATGAGAAFLGTFCGGADAPPACTGDSGTLPYESGTEWRGFFTTVPDGYSLRLDFTSSGGSHALVTRDMESGGGTTGAWSVTDSGTGWATLTTASDVVIDFPGPGTLTVWATGTELTVAWPTGASPTAVTDDPIDWCVTGP